MGQKLKDLDLHSKEGFNPHTQKLKGDVTRVLKDLHHELSSVKTQNASIAKLIEQIDRIQTSIASAPLEKPKIPLKIGFFCDLDNDDYNGAITSRLTLSLQQNLPFITTRSMLRATGMTEKKVVEESQALEELLLKTQEDYEIFQQFDLESGNEFFLFLPKTLEPAHTGMHKLRALDFATDGTLKQVTVMEALQGPTRKGDIKAFGRLFTRNPKVDKIFYLAGHGSNTYVGALKQEHYLEFLEILRAQRCKGLSITSCSSGGESSKLNIPQEHKGQDLPYTIIVRSIGGFPTYSGQKAEENLKEFYDEFAAFLESPQAETIPRVRKFVEKIEAGSGKSHVNLMKVYFAHSAGVPGGFRPVGEHGLGFALTYAVLQGHQIDRKEAIQVKDKEFLEVHPLVTSTPVIFTKKDPILLSMLPGKGHHFLQAMKLDQMPVRLFIKKTAEFHMLNATDADKAFFIGSLEGPDRTFEEVAIWISSSGSFSCVYRQGADYFFSDGTNVKGITPFQHALFCKEAAEATAPDTVSIRTTTGGQEKEADFIQALDLPEITSKEVHTLTREEKESFDFFIHFKCNSLAEKRLFFVA